MKIWFLTSEFPPEYGGGIGMYVDQVSKMFARVGNDITVFTRNNEESVEEYPEEHLRYVRFQHCSTPIYSTMGYWSALSYQFAEEVMKVLRSDKTPPDIIEVQEYGAIGYYLLTKKLLGEPLLKHIPIVVHLHTPVFELSRINQAPRYKFPNYWVGQMEIFCMKAADSLLCPSEYLKTKIQRYAENNPITVINLPYLIENIQEYPERNQESKAFLYGGRTEYRKGIYQAISVFEELWNEGYQIKLRIFGGDTYFHPKAVKLGDLIRKKYGKWMELGLLQLHNSIPPKKLDLEFLNSMAVLVPSIYENFPYSCVTAMWLGSPMIVSKQGGQAEMVAEDGVNGFIFDWEKEDLKEKILQVIEMDAKQLNRIGENGKQRIHDLCNVEKNIALRTAYFETIIASHTVKTQFPFMNSEITKNSFIHEEEIGKKQLLSIIIPYYNLGEYIQETVDCAFRTEYEPKEVILVNDGTTEENSLNILQSLSEQYPSLNIINIENGGLSNARNVGVYHAKGEWVTFLDADDLVQENFYSKAISILNQYENVSFVYSWVEYFDEGSGIWPTFPTEFPYLLCANMLSAFCVVRRADYQNFGRNRKTMEYGMEDYDSWLSLASNGYFGVSIPEPLVRYRIRKDSMARQFNADTRLYLADRMSEGHIKTFQQYGKEIYSLLLENGPSYFWNNPTYEMPPLGFLHAAGSKESQPAFSNDPNKYELMRIANSKLGSKLINFAFKAKLNRFFK